MSLSTPKEKTSALRGDIFGFMDGMGEYAPSIAIPGECRGEVRLVSKRGPDAIRFVCRDEFSGQVRRIEDASILSQDGRRPLHLLRPGIWTFSAYNETRKRFERVTKRFSLSEKKAGKFLLEVVSGSSAEDETRVVFEVRFPRERKE